MENEIKDMHFEHTKTDDGQVFTRHVEKSSYVDIKEIEFINESPTSPWESFNDDSTSDGWIKFDFSPPKAINKYTLHRYKFNGYAVVLRRIDNSCVDVIYKFRNKSRAKKFYTKFNTEFKVELPLQIFMTVLYKKFESN